MKQKEKCEELTNAYFLGFVIFCFCFVRLQSNRGHESVLFVQCTQYGSSDHADRRVDSTRLILSVMPAGKLKTGRSMRGDCLAVI